MKIDPDAMTLDEIRDWMAEKAGWKSRPYADSETFLLWTHPEKGESLATPFPPTLDAAAAAMPEGWYWWVNFTGLIVPFHAVAIQRVPTQPQIETRGDTEIETRFRLAVLCILAEEASK